MSIENMLHSKIAEAARIFSQGPLFKHIVIPDFDCTGLPPKETDGKNLPDSLVTSFFSHLHQFDETEGKINAFPCIYAFELIAPENAKDVIINAFQAQQQMGIERTLPALKKSIPDSNYLYVGKVNSGVGGRLVTHLGYYQRKGNHGLQLAFWAREMVPALHIKVHVFRFPVEFTPYISAFEVIMAKELNPLIGKH